MLDLSVGDSATRAGLVERGTSAATWPGTGTGEVEVCFNFPRGRVASGEAETPGAGGGRRPIGSDSHWLESGGGKSAIAGGDGPDVAAFVPRGVVRSRLKPCDGGEEGGGEDGAEYGEEFGGESEGWVGISSLSTLPPATGSDRTCCWCFWLSNDNVFKA